MKPPSMNLGRRLFYEGDKMKPEDEDLFNEDMFDHKDKMVLEFCVSRMSSAVRYFAILEAAKRDMPVLLSSRIDGALQPLPLAYP
jgi:hypothetical protein